MSSIPESEVRAELERILASRGFAAAGRISKLLRYVVEKTLAGEIDQLKEYAVGVEVFDRDGSYDPRLDSIVRVEAGRLRSKLDEYYNDNGAGSNVRISLPRGGYAALFEPRPVSVAAREPQTETARQPKPSTISWLWVAGLSGVITAMIVWLVLWGQQRQPDVRPTIAVLAFQANMIGGDETTSRYLTEALTSELTRLGTLNVASHTSAMQLQGRRLSSKEQSATLHSTYLVEGSMDDEGGMILVVPRLVNGETERKLWVADYRGDYSEVRTIAQRIAFDVNTEVLKRESGR